MSNARMQGDGETQTPAAATVVHDPFGRFEVWLAEAIKAGVSEPNSMVLATAAAGGMPSARIVLLGSFDSNGFVFFADHNSRKGRELSENPHAALLFYWSKLERQVRVEGEVERVPTDTLAELISPKNGSRTLRSVQVRTVHGLLTQKFTERAKRWQAIQTSQPGMWGAYILRPNAFEFWQGREGRPPVRLFYSRAGKTWRLNGRAGPGNDI